jgi:hypothetical protein
MKTPVTSFELYLSKLHPDNSNLWQRPKKAENVPEALWYDSVAVGKTHWEISCKNLVRKPNFQNHIQIIVSGQLVSQI